MGGKLMLGMSEPEVPKIVGRGHKDQKVGGPKNSAHPTPSMALTFFIN